jgi:hypothetical protein
MESLKGALFSITRSTKYPKYMQSITIHLPRPCQLEILEELGEVFPNLSGISQRGSFPVPGQQLSKMHVEHDHSPTSPPYQWENLKELGEGFPNVGKFLVSGRIVGSNCKIFFLNGRAFDF